MYIFKDTRLQQLYAIASQQQGYFSAKQALSCGYSYRLQHYHKSMGHWSEIGRGVFRLVNFPSFPDEEFVRWSLWSRNRNDEPQAVISHESALAFHELSDVLPAKIHLTVPLNYRKNAPAGCVLHKKILSSETIQKKNGYFVTTPLQTIIDVAESNLELDQLEQAVRDAFNKGILVPANLAVRMPPKARNKISFVLQNIKKKPIF